MKQVNANEYDKHVRSFITGTCYHRTPTQIIRVTGIRTMQEGNTKRTINTRTGGIIAKQVATKPYTRENKILFFISE